MQKRYHDFSQVDFTDHEISDLEEQYEKEQQEIEESTRL